MFLFNGRIGLGVQDRLNEIISFDCFVIRVGTITLSGSVESGYS